MKKALFLIIDKMGDVSYAISFAKEQDDPDLWNDLLDYSMDKPHFIRGLLEEVGTAIDPITLVRRIPEGLEIEGLRDGIRRMVREYEIQFSISDGVAKVLRSEVASAMETLRAGRKRGVKFDVVGKQPEHVDVFVEPLSEAQESAEPSAVEKQHVHTPSGIKPGHCVGCNKAFTEDGTYYDGKSLLVIILTSIYREGNSHRLCLRPRLPPFLSPRVCRLRVQRFRCFDATGAIRRGSGHVES